MAVLNKYGTLIVGDFESGNDTKIVKCYGRVIVTFQWGQITLRWWGNCDNNKKARCLKANLPIRRIAATLVASRMLLRLSMDDVRHLVNDLHKFKDEV